MSFTERLAAGEQLIFDGGMGSMLAVRGADGSDGNPNLVHPTIVQEVHRLYLEAGADCLITNTLVLNEIYMAKRQQLATLDDAVRAAVENALEAAHGQALVFGDLGPIGDMLKPYGPGEPEAFYAAFCRLARVLAEQPIDGFIIETVFQLAEAELMLKACQEVAPHLPIICSLTFSQLKGGGRTIMGDQAIRVAETAAELGAVVVGCNCGDLAPQELAEILKYMAPAGLPLIVQPNAGKPRLEQGQIIYDLGPAAFASQMLACWEAGAQLFGGCCGTTPDHIAALKQALG